MSAYPGRLFRPCLICKGPLPRPSPGSRLRLRILCSSCAMPNPERVGKGWSRRELLEGEAAG